MDLLRPGVSLGSPGLRTHLPSSARALPCLPDGCVPGSMGLASAQHFSFLPGPARAFLELWVWCKHLLSQTANLKVARELCGLGPLPWRSPPAPISRSCPGTGSFGRFPRRDRQQSPGLETPHLVSWQRCLRVGQGAGSEEGSTSKLNPTGGPHPLLSGNKFWAQFCCSQARDPLASHFAPLSSVSKGAGTRRDLPDRAVVCQAG